MIVRLMRFDGFGVVQAGNVRLSDAGIITCDALLLGRWAHLLVHSIRLGASAAITACGRLHDLTLPCYIASS